MKHVRDPEYPQHESSFRCKVCEKRIEGFIYALGDFDGPEDCPGIMGKWGHAPVDPTAGNEVNVPQSRRYEDDE